MKSENKLDGGIVALAGFLYQMIGILAMKARALQITPPQDPQKLDALLIGEVRHEYLGQDAVIRLPSLGIEEKDQYILVQFKFSGKITDRPQIKPSELKKISTQMSKSAQEAQQISQEVSKYILVTNRQYSPDTRKIMESIESGYLPPNISKGQCAVLQNLLVKSDDAEMYNWIEELSNYARTHFGCGENEIKDGIGKLVADLLWRTCNGSIPDITEDHLKEAFTGTITAGSLLPANVAKFSRNQADVFATDNHLKQPRLVRRRVLDRISELVSEQALVLIYGEGGGGKTATLWQWISEFLSSNLPQYAAIMSVNDIRPDCLSHLICDWLDLSQSANWRAQVKPEHPLERLHTASPESKRPILYLCVDAIDEGLAVTDYAHIKALLRWFWKEELDRRRSARTPQATLIITCRDKNKLAEDQWLPSKSSFDTDVDLECIEIGDFSQAELLDVARITLPKLLYMRFKATLSGDTSQIAPSPQVVDPLAQAVDVQILQALRHPILWQSLLGLENFSIQSQILNGNPDAIRQLAEKFIAWFCIKAKKRGSMPSKCSLQKILATIAQKSKGSHQIRQSRNDWIGPACSTGMMLDLEAGRLYDEALSAGLILRDDENSWRWRHQFVCDFLVSCST